MARATARALALAVALAVAHYVISSTIHRLDEFVYCRRVSSMPIGILVLYAENDHLIVDESFTVDESPLRRGSA